MAGNPYDDVVVGFQEEQAKRAQARTVGVQPVSPTAAAQAHSDASTGIPPAFGMQDPKPGAAAALAQRNRVAIDTSPHVASFAANADPASVAASQDSFDHYTGIGKAAQGYFTAGGMLFNDLTQPMTEAWKSLQRANARVENPDVLQSLRGRLQQVESTGALVLSPVSGAFNALVAAPARGLAEQVQPPQFAGQLLDRLWNIGNPLYEGERLLAMGLDKTPPPDPFAQMTKPEAANFYTSAAGFAAVGLGLKGKGGTAVEGEAAAPKGGPPHVPPTGPTLSPEGFVVDAKGEPATFASTREAAQFIRTHYANEASSFSVPSENGVVRVQRVEPLKPAGVVPEQNDFYTAQAETDASHVANLEERVAASPAFTRSPSIVQEFMQDHTALGEQTAWVGAAALGKLAAEGVTPFPQHADALAEAATTGRDVPIPMPEYLAAVSGQPFADELRAATRFREDGVSVEGGKELPTLPELTFSDEGKSFSVTEPGGEEIFAQGNVGANTGNLQITGTNLPADLRGRGLGVSMYEMVAQEAHKRGGMLFSDYSLSADAIHIYEALARRGYEVLRNPKAFEPNLKTVQLATEKADGPVFRVGPKKEAPAPVLPPDVTPDEATRVQSSVMATRRAIRETFQTAFIKQLFADNKAAGMTKGQFERYSLRLEAAQAAGEAKALAKAVRAVRAERKPAFASALEQHIAAVEQEVATIPAVVARHALLYNESPLGAPLDAPKVKLNRQGVVNTYGQDVADALPKGVFGATETVTADMVVDELGLPYASGLAMLRDIIRLEGDGKARGLSPREHFKGLVKDEALARTRVEKGFDVSPEAIAQAASDAVVVPEVERLLIEELQALGKQVGLPLDEEGIKTEANRLFQAMTVRDAVNIREFERGMWKTGKAGEDALLKGKVEDAFALRQQQLLNWYQLRDAHELKRVLASSSKKFARYARKKTVGGMNQNYLDQLHDLLPKYGFPTQRDPAELVEALDGVDLPAFVGGVRYSNPLFTPIPAAPPQPFPSSSVADFWSARAFIADMIRYGRESQGLITAEGVQEHAALVQRALAEAPPGGTVPPARLGGRKTFGEEAIHALKGYDASHRKVTRMLEELGRYSFDSVWAETVSRVLNQGAGQEATLREKMHGLEQRYNLIPKDLRKTYNAIIEDHPFFAPDGRKLELVRGDVPGMALHVGTESSLERLAEGFSSTPQDVMEFLDAHITVEEARLVQAFWDQFEELSGAVSTDLRALRGVGLEKLPARAWRTPHGDFPGGYFPLRRDRVLSPLLPEEVTAEEMLDPAARLFRDVAPDEGFSKARTGARYVVDVSLPRAYTAFDDHVRFVSYARRLASIRRFVSDPDIRALVVNKLGPEYYDLIDPYLNSIVSDWTVADKSMGPVMGAVDYFRKNLSLFALAGSATTTLSQAAGLPVIAAELGDGTPGSGTKWIGIGIGAFTKSLVTANLDADIFSKSVFMRHRFGESNPVAAEALSRLRGFHTYAEFQVLYNEVVKAGYNVIGLAEFLTASGPGWMGAYNKAVGELDYPEAKAVEYADRVVEKSQGSGRRIDLAAVQRGNAFQKMLYLFSTFFNASYQYAAEGIGQAKQGNYGKAAAIGFGVFFIAPMAGALLTDNGPEDLNPVTMAEWMAMQSFLNLTRPLFWLGSPLSVVGRNLHFNQGKVHSRRPQDWDFSSDPMTRMAESVVRTAALPFFRNKAGALSDKRPIATAIRGAGAVAPIPFGTALARAAQYIADLHDGKVHPASLDEAAHDLLIGAKPKAAASGGMHRPH